jgi:hypothetical protein
VATAGPSRWAYGAVIAAVFVLAIGGTAAHPSTGAQGAVGPAVEGGGAVPCNLSSPSPSVRGIVSADGGPLATAGELQATLRYAYVVGFESVGESSNAEVASGCEVVRTNVTTAENGSFSFRPGVPPSACGPGPENSDVCTNYSGPFGPLHLVAVSPQPAGYAVWVGGTSADALIRLVYELATVSIDPSGSELSGPPGAPIDLVATAWAANGTLSTLGPTFAWQLNGTGWSFDGPTNRSAASLTASPGAGPALVTVTAAASVDGTALAPVRANVTVVAVPTEAEVGGTNRSEVDVGLPVSFSLSAVGAAGYAYRATLDPGLGAPPVPLACTPGPAANGSQTIACVGSASYAETGTAAPVATVTNTFSSASWAYGPVIVNPPPELDLSPTAPIGYAGASIALTATVTNRSGTAPYAGACLVSPPVVTLCSGSPGPSWAFAPTYAEPGSYPATVSAIDADGSNASASVTVVVVPPLGLGPVVPSEQNVSVGSALTLRANLSGGVLPVRFWWNASTASGPVLEGTAAADGPLSLVLAPNSTGRWVVTLTVVDRLGSFESSELVVTVGPQDAERVVPVVGPPGAATTAGATVAVVWAAFAVSGGVDPSFATAATIGLQGPSGTPVADVSAPGVGLLTRLGNGTYGVPSAAWLGGYLRVNLTVLTAGPLSVSLAGAGVPGGVAPVNLSVAPDRTQLRLFAPSVARAGPRDNATLWRATDRFGNAVPGAAVTIELAFGAERDDVVVTALALPDDASGAWINYSAPGPGAGTVTVVDEAGDVLLGPLAVPAVPAPPGLGPAVTTLAAIGPAGAAGSVAFAVVRRRRRRRASPGGDAELQALAEGRARTVELIEAAGATDLAGLEAAWGGAAPPALADWVASLVADGTVRGTVGPDGRPRFCLADRPHAAPRVTVDTEALDRSLRRRDAALDDGSNASEEPPA